MYSRTTTLFYGLTHTIPVSEKNKMKTVKHKSTEVEDCVPSCYRTTMRDSRAGPTPMNFTGTWMKFEMNSMYLRQLAGSCSYERTSAVLVSHPGRVS